MEIIGIVVSVIVGLYLIWAGFSILSLALGFGSTHKSDYVYPIIMICAGIAIEYYVFFEALTFSVGVK